QAKSFNIVQFNVLADGLSGADPSQGGFVLTPSESLQWHFRSSRLVEEIQRWRPDIVCLQEVDHFEDFFVPEFSRWSFKGVYARKPNSPCAGDLSDGCAIFISNRFDMLSSRTLNYSLPKPGIEEDKEVEVSNQVGIISVLKDKKISDKDSRLLVVATTHLKATKNQEGENMRAHQVQQLFDEVNRVRESLALGFPTSSVDIVICGDFNAPPEDTNGIVAACYPTACAHPLELASVYNSPEALDSVELYSTWKVRPKGEVKWCIDYVFYRGELQPTRLGSLPRGEVDGLAPCRLPGFQYPSDHLALPVCFQYL
ncbi:unnamed protein product, partial [Heterosigma akashiwo]